MNFLLENCDLLVRKFVIVNFNIKYTGYFVRLCNQIMLYFLPNNDKISGNLEI